MMNANTHTKLGVIYGNEPDTRDLAKKFIGHLMNYAEFCTACEEFEQKLNCDECRQNLKSYSDNIYYYEEIGSGLPQFIDDPDQYLPEELKKLDFLVVVGIHEDLLAGLPDFLKGSKIKAVIVPIENPKWVPPGLQTQVLHSFERAGIQGAFPKPFCALNTPEDEYNKVGFNLTSQYNYVTEFIDNFKIGKPIVAFKRSKDNKAIDDCCVIRSAPCGSTYYIVQQLKGKYIENGKANTLSLNERISKAHHAYPCNASMDQDSILRDSILHVGGYLVRNAVRKALNLEEEEGEKLNYIIK
ncbi:MAG: Thymidylate synthase [Promethearchaeota archaeon]|nr:MAG: Thymidylate synthase [Candidatus Lokiarchaeota archaeon]